MAVISGPHRHDGGSDEIRNASLGEAGTSVRPRSADVQMQSAFVGTDGDPGE